VNSKVGRFAFSHSAGYSGFSGRRSAADTQMPTCFSRFFFPNFVFMTPRTLLQSVTGHVAVFVHLSFSPDRFFLPGIYI